MALFAMLYKHAGDAVKNFIRHINQDGFFTINPADCTLMFDTEIWMSAKPANDASLDLPVGLRIDTAKKDRCLVTLSLDGVPCDIATPEGREQAARHFAMMAGQFAAKHKYNERLVAYMKRELG
jgi:hypothetical protein